MQQGGWHGDLEWKGPMSVWAFGMTEWKMAQENQRLREPAGEGVGKQRLKSRLLSVNESKRTQHEQYDGYIGSV